MPRLARLDAAGVLHHAIMRGIERRPGVMYVVRRAVRREERIANEGGMKLTH